MRVPSFQIVDHTKSCKRRASGACRLCKRLVALCLYHAKFCQVSELTACRDYWLDLDFLLMFLLPVFRLQEAKCVVPFCLNLKNKMKQQEKHGRRQQSLTMKRRMAIMTASASSSNQAGPHTPVASDYGAGPGTPKTEQPGTPRSNHMMGPPMPGSQPGGPGTPNSNQMGLMKPMNIMPTHTNQTAQVISQQPVRSAGQVGMVAQVQSAAMMSPVGLSPSPQMQQQQTQQVHPNQMISPQSVPSSYAGVVRTASMYQPQTQDSTSPSSSCSLCQASWRGRKSANHQCS